MSQMNPLIGPVLSQSSLFAMKKYWVYIPKLWLHLWTTYIEIRSITFFSNFRVVGNPVKSEDPRHTIDLGDHDGIPSVGGDWIKEKIIIYISTAMIFKQCFCDKL